MRRNKILVVGGSGFIGSYLMKKIKADNLDLRQGEDVINGINKKYKTIVFLACNQSDTQEAYHDNNKMYMALDNYMERYPMTRVIYASSAAVYHRLNKYAQSKLLGEACVKRYDNYAIVRIFNVYGHGDGHGAPDRFLRGEKTICGDGKQTRDIIPVESVVDGIQQLIQTRSLTGVFNICTGTSISVNRMFDLFGSGKSRYIKGNAGVRSSNGYPGEVAYD